MTRDGRLHVTWSFALEPCMEWTRHDTCMPTSSLKIRLHNLNQKRRIVCTLHHRQDPAHGWRLKRLKPALVRGHSQLQYDARQEHNVCIGLWMEKNKPHKRRRSGSPPCDPNTKPDGLMCIATGMIRVMVAEQPCMVYQLQVACEMMPTSFVRLGLHCDDRSW
jgi:hypothetical protein